MTYMVMTKHPIFGEIVVDVLYDKGAALDLVDSGVYGKCWVEEIEHEGEVQE